MNIVINQKDLEIKINSTPTGPERNALCDLNILAQNGKMHPVVFIPTSITNEIVNGLDDSEYYYVITSGGYRETWKGFAIKNNPTRIQTILIEQ